jgi:acyl carrier protein
MDEMENRLVRCFSSVFPNLSAEQIRAASVESVPAWDSLAAVTLVAVLQEEFGLQISLMDLPDLVSFVAVEKYVREHNSAS